MTESFDIQDADTINTLILICKTNLKMNQYLDSGDIEGFQKISKFFLLSHSLKVHYEGVQGPRRTTGVTN